MRISPSTARALAWLAIAGQFVFVAGWIVGGALQPGYSHIESAVSELGADSAAHPWIVNGALVVLGLAITAVGPTLVPALTARTPARVAAALFVAAGLCFAAAGLIPVDCFLSHDTCERMWRAGELSWQTDAHVWLAFGVEVFLALTPFALAWALWPGPAAPLALGAGGFGIVLGVAEFLLDDATENTYGLIQRISLGFTHLWILIVAGGVLYALRRTPKPGALVPLRPRDFFAASWAGEGELTVRPFLFWRRFPQRMQARRTTTWISERVWRFDDEATFAPGRSQQRLMYGEFVTDDRIRITAGDLPEGAEALIEENGYRVIPFRMDFPIGPLNIPIRVHDVSSVEPDGTLVNAFEARTLVFGVKVAELKFRVRPLAPGGERV